VDLPQRAARLALLKRKDVLLTGVDISDCCASIARQNGYDAAYVAELTSLPFADAVFDYVVTLDVIGHVGFDEKDAVLAEIRRVLRQNGTTLHGIECLDRSKRKDYHQMTEHELRRYISVDGHVGMEDETEIAARFGRFFEHVQTRPRFVMSQSHEEFLKQADEYGTPLCEPDFLDYLRGMSFKERRAFNMAMGYVFGQISEHGINLPNSEYVLLKASGSALGEFYNQHRDETRDSWIREESLCLDRSPSAEFDGGWFDAELLPPVARWMKERACVRFEAAPFSRLRMDLTTHIPNVHLKPLVLEFLLNGRLASRFSLFRTGWLELELDLLDVANGSEKFELEIRADRTWQPRPHDSQQRDDRELSIAVCNLELS
jgi:SAM-dependent methyltransferase